MLHMRMSFLLLASCAFEPTQQPSAIGKLDMPAGDTDGYDEYDPQQPPAPLGTQTVFVSFDSQSLERIGDEEPDIASQNQSSVINSLYKVDVGASIELAGWSASEEHKDDFLERVTSLFDAYDVEFTVTRPQQGDYTMLVVTDRIGHHARLGVSPVDCSNTNRNDIVIVAAGNIALSADERNVNPVALTALIAAHELGHSFGLTHVVFDRTQGHDVMSPAANAYDDDLDSVGFNRSIVQVTGMDETVLRTCDLSLEYLPEGTVQDGPKILAQNLGVRPTGE